MSTPNQTSSGRATYQDVLDAPPHMVAEVIDGVLYTMPRPAIVHAQASSSLGAHLVRPFGHGSGGPGGWWILDEPELHLGEDILVPDMAGWQRERVPRLPDGAYWTLSPDWVCEVLSPSTRKIDLGAKRGIYARERVAYMWLVDPNDRSLESFELRDGGWRRLARLTGNQRVSQPPFDAVSFSLGDLWADAETSWAHRRQPRVHDEAGAP